MSRLFLNGVTIFCLLSGSLAITLAEQEVRAVKIEPGPLNKIVTKWIPAYPSAEIEVIGTVGKDWEEGYRRATRYVGEVKRKLQRGRVLWPVVVKFPDWTYAPPGETARMLIHMPLLDGLKYPKATIEKKVSVVPQERVRVVSYAYRGSYSFENCQDALTKLTTLLKENSIQAVGPPRHVLHNSTSFTPSWLLTSEVQIPIAADAVVPE